MYCLAACRFHQHRGTELQSCFAVVDDRVGLDDVNRIFN
jgi:hypothetical protein